MAAIPVRVRIPRGAPLEGRPAPTSAFTSHERVVLPGESLTGQTFFKTIPRVTAVLVISDIRRIPLARCAVNNFVQQRYWNKHLIVVNSTGLPVTNVEHPLVTEIEHVIGRSHGEMRNAAIDAVDRIAHLSPIYNAGNDWIAHWPDDSYSHPDRLAFQMTMCGADLPIALHAEIRIDIVRSVAYYCAQVGGIPSTLIHPRRTNEGARYDETISGGEQIEYVERVWHHRYVVVRNTGPDATLSQLQMSFWHAGHWVGRDDFLGRYAADEDLGMWRLGAEDLAYAQRVLNDVYHMKLGPALTDGVEPV